MAKALRLGVAYDFRNPPASGMSHQSLYAAIMDQVAWLDGLGLDLVWFTEHHFVEDGYLPSWIPVAAAMAARTRHVRFSCDVCLLPFNHPIRLAEDLAVLDNISGGRVEIGVGMGYAPHEFRGFGLVEQWDTEELAALTSPRASWKRIADTDSPVRCDSGGKAPW